jgi:hypothetical protein
VERALGQRRWLRRRPPYLPRVFGVQRLIGALGDDRGLRNFRLGRELLEGLHAVAPGPKAQKAEIEIRRLHRADLQPA